LKRRVIIILNKQSRKQSAKLKGIKEIKSEEEEVPRQRLKNKIRIAQKNRAYRTTRKFIVKTAKTMQIMLIASALVFIFINVRYKAAYAVTIDGETIGYVSNKEEFQEQINANVLTTDDEKVAFVSLDTVEYNETYVAKTLINEDETLDEIKDKAQNIYRVYEVGIIVEDNNSTEEDESSNDSEKSNASEVESKTAVYFVTEEEAQAYADTLKSEYGEVGNNIAITTLYIENEISEDAIKEAKAQIESELQAQEEALEKQKEIEARTVNGIYLACLPVQGGTISSRFGAVESIRNHVHGGLDIAAAYGTPIYAAADGTVIYSGWMSGYGYLVKIDHGNGIQTYYGHCSKLYVSVGTKVTAGTKIAAVGSTGNSTGNHCHFEVRINGVAVNPQKYLYRSY